MAIFIVGITECSLCHKKLTKDDRTVATTHFIGDTQDPLWKYSDSVMHYDCFMAWSQRHTFVDKFNQAGLPYTMKQDGSYNKRDCSCSSEDLYAYGCHC